MITAAGAPVPIGGRSRNVFLQDLDGFVIELGQPTEPPAPTPETPGNVFRAEFEAAVRDTDTSVALTVTCSVFRPTSRRRSTTTS